MENLNSKQRLGQTLHRIETVWANIEEMLWTILFIAMMCMMFVQVMSRFVFHIAVPWTEEFIRYSFIAGAYMAVGANLLHDSHIQIDVLATFIVKIKDMKNRRRAAAFMDILRYAVVAACGVYMGTMEFQYVFKQASIGATSAAMHLPMAIMYAIITYGYFSMVGHSIFKIFVTLTNHDIIIDQTLLKMEGGEN